MSSAPISSGQNNDPEKESAPVLVKKEGTVEDGAHPAGLVGQDLVREIHEFGDDCIRRYKFNSRWDNVLNVVGILLSVCIVAAGVYQRGALSAILGAFVAAIVGAQKAFPFGQRVNFYRILVGQSENLETDVQQGLVSKQDAVAILKSLRLDFAQQLPRGSTFNAGDNSSTSGPK